jgi:hypothetical protein
VLLANSVSPVDIPLSALTWERFPFPERSSENAGSTVDVTKRDVAAAIDAPRGALPAALAGEGVVQGSDASRGGF